MLFLYKSVQGARRELEFARESNAIDTSRRTKLYSASSYIRKFVLFRRDFEDFAIRVSTSTLLTRHLNQYAPILPASHALMLAA